MRTINLEIPTPEWAEPLLPPARYKGAKGGRASGKSQFFAGLLVEESVANPDLRSVCIREVQRSLKFSAKSLIEKKIREFGVEGEFNILEREIRRRGGRGIIIFEGMQDHTADSLKSLEGFGRAWVEEAQNLSKRSMELLLPTIREPGSEIWFSWNPDQPTDPVDTLFSDLASDPDAVVVHVTYRQNPFCPEESRKDAARSLATDPDAHEHIWLGGYNKRSQARVLAGIWVSYDFEPGEDWDGPYYGLDFGFSQDPFSCNEVWVNAETLYIRREAYKIELELDDTPDFLRRRLPGCEGYVIRADSARPDSISYLKRHGFPKIVGCPKPPGSVEDGIAHLRQYKKIVIHPDCEGTIDEARLWSYKVDPKTGDVLPTLIDKHNNAWDAVRYSLFPLIRFRKPTHFDPRQLTPRMTSTF